MTERPTERTDSDVETGQWLMESPMTDNLYIVTKRRKVGDGKYVAEEKELVKRV